MKNMKKIVSITAVALLGQYASAAIITAATANGDINAGATWTGGAAPVVGDENQWDTGTLTVKTITQTWEGQELRVQTGGRLASGVAGPKLTMNGDLTLDGGTITVLNNNAFLINLTGKTFNLNSGTLDSGNLNNGRDIVFQNAVLAGNGTINIQGTTAAAATDRSAVTFQESVNTTGFTGVFKVTDKANFLLPTIAAADASFGIDVNGSGQLSMAKNIAVTSAVFDGLEIANGIYTRDELLGLGVNSNRILSGDYVEGSTLTVIPEPATLGLIAIAGFGVLFVRRRFSI